MMKEQLKEKTKESLASVLPITVIVFLLSATVVPMETGTLLLFLIGAMLLIVGMGIFQLGAELAMTPLGQSIGSRMIKGNKLWATVLICFFMGAIITIAEPDLQVLANQVASIPNNVLIYTVAGGVGIFLVIAFLRILYRISLSQTLTVLYILLFLLSFGGGLIRPGVLLLRRVRPGPAGAAERKQAACQEKRDGDAGKLHNIPLLLSSFYRSARPETRRKRKFLVILPKEMAAVCGNL